VPLWLNKVLFKMPLKPRSDPQMTQMNADVKKRNGYAQRLSKTSEWLGKFESSRVREWENFRSRSRGTRKRDRTPEL